MEKKKNTKNRWKRGIWIGAGLLLAGMTAGCQSVTKVEFYDVTEHNSAFSVPSQDGKLGHGPIKTIEGKSGMPDWSDGKSFKFSLSFFGM